MIKIVWKESKFYLNNQINVFLGKLLRREIHIRIFQFFGCCFQVQEMENRASALKNELAKNFKKTSKKLAEIIPNEEEYNDHDYLDTFEPHSSSQSVPEESASDNKSVVDDLEIPEEETVIKDLVKKLFVQMKFLI